MPHLDEVRRHPPIDPSVDEGRAAASMACNNVMAFSIITEFLVHLLPDIATLHPKLHTFTKDYKEDRWNLANFLPFVPLTGCAVRVDRNEKGNPICHRLLEWVTAGTGAETIIVKRNYSDGRQNITEAIIPGFCGTFNGMSPDITACMNVCPGEARVERQGNTITFGGIPSAFLNRQLLERCKSVDEVKTTLSTVRHLGAYHLIVTDKITGMVAHVMQGRDQSNIYRYLPEEGHLTVLNCVYDDEGGMHQELSNDRKRHDIIASHASGRTALIDRRINGWMATHLIEMWHGEKSSFSIVFGNGFLSRDSNRDRAPRLTG